MVIMADDYLKKIADFLKEYLDFYGDNLFVDTNRIKELFPVMKEPIPEITSHKQPEIKPAAPRPKTEPESPLWKFREKIKNCTNCPLGHTRTTFVFGDGNANADIIFIGEAPGFEEDRTGIPFVGRAGQLLNKLLSHIKVEREDVFIANILKCRPPNNRDPQPAEIKECIPYLDQQIEMIQPKIIVALGRVAAQNLLNNTSSLKQLRNRLWQYRGFDMIVTYHPAAILRNMGLLNTTIEDFKYIHQTYLQKLKHQS